MAAKKATKAKTAIKASGPRHETVNLKEPELFQQMFAVAKRRKLPKMSLSALARFVFEEWLEHNED